MPTKVVFLGAGASAPLGFPVTSQILRWIVRAINDQSLFDDDHDSRMKLDELLNEIMPGLKQLPAEVFAADSKVPLPMITDVLSLVDYLTVHSNAASARFHPKEFPERRMLLERAIFEALTRSFNTPLVELPDTLQKQQAIAYERARLGPAEPPKFLTTLVDWIQEDAKSGKVTIISTNYDIAVESELFRRINYYNVWSNVDFGCEVRQPDTGEIIRPPENASFGVYKLHGSLNWLRCDLCDHIYINPVGSIAYLAFLENAGDAGLCHCGFSPLRHLMVAPSIVRDVRDPNLLEVWRNALEVMRVAEDWVIIGYSLPPEDIAIRSLFLRAMNSRHRRADPNVTVVQRDNSAETQYKLLFRNVDYRTGGVEKFLGMDVNAQG